MPAAEQGAQAAQPQPALGGCGDSTRKIRLASKCKSWEQTLCLCLVSQSRLAALCLPPRVLALMKLTIYDSFIVPGGLGLVCLYISQLV